MYALEILLWTLFPATSKYSHLISYLLKSSRFLGIFDMILFLIFSDLDLLFRSFPTAISSLLYCMGINFFSFASMSSSSKVTALFPCSFLSAITGFSGTFLVVFAFSSSFFIRSSSSKSSWSSLSLRFFLSACSLLFLYSGRRWIGVFSSGSKPSLSAYICLCRSCARSRFLSLSSSHLLSLSLNKEFHCHANSN